MSNLLFLLCDFKAMYHFMQVMDVSSGLQNGSVKTEGIKQYYVGKIESLQVGLFYMPVQQF